MDTRVKPESTLNPLLEDWDTPYGLPPFDAIRAEHFAPALQVAMQANRAELDAIAAQAEAPSFDNTLSAFDRCARLLSRIEGVFYNLTASHTSPELQAVQRELAAPLSAHYSAVFMHAGLFKRVDALFAQRESLALQPEQLRLLERTHLDFVRAGARFAPEAQARYAQVMERLAELTTTFAQNVLHDEASFQLVLRGEADLAGLPAFARDAARQAALERGLPDAHVITLSRSLIVPFLTFSQRRDLREQAWRAWVGRGEHAGEHDNRPVARAILELRSEQAALHGHSCYADFALTDTMAGTRAAVHKLLDDVWPRALAALQRERQELEEVMRAQADGPAAGPIEAWDWRYWAEKVRQQRYALDDAQIKPYFPLQRVVQAAFDCAQRLFGLRFTPREDLPVYHPDVKAYEVRNAAGAVVAIFLQDNFARSAKRSGAWMSSLRQQSRNEPGGGAALAVVLNNNNFAKGAPGAPTLLSLDDARTLFHEFGHGLHGMLSNVTYPSLSGTSVFTDFVELPSQLYEHWQEQPQVLRQFATHYQTGEPLPDDLLQRFLAARKFNQGFATVEFVSSALIDLEFHTQPASSVGNVREFERKELDKIGMPEEISLRHRPTQFGHIFSGDHYASGYYSYMWSEVMDADAFGAFEEAGNIFDPKVAKRLHDDIYASGGSRDPEDAYIAFRGRAPEPDALLRRRGLLDTPEAA
ncbi:MAG TPA: M3 family metallopeptidase [Rubrivivax sp.]|nr:M3 family metallopeptidase [Rubrivivax sp.]